MSETRIVVSPRMIFGLLLMVAGVLFTLDNLGLVHADRWLSYWPLGLVAVGVTRMTGAVSPGGRASGVLWILAGAALLLDNLDVVDLDDMWPLGLVALGGYLILRSIPGQALPERASTADQLSAFVLMCGVNRRTASQDFRGGEFSAIMGGVEVDLSRAAIASSPAVIDTFAFWGGIEIRVPETWEVVSQGMGLMGGFADETRHPDVPEQVLIVKGFAIMGGIEIKN